jgi:hypothetical protein
MLRAGGANAIQHCWSLIAALEYHCGANVNANDHCIGQIITIKIRIEMHQCKRPSSMVVRALTKFKRAWSAANRPLTPSGRV